MAVNIKHSKHLIFGAGLIGCYLGGVLSYLGLNTQLISRPKIVKKLNKGIKLTDYLAHQSPIIPLSFIDSAGCSLVNDIDFLWLTIKCTGIEQALKDITPFVGKNTVILCCQNGLGSDRIVKQQFKDNPVLRVMIPFNVVELRAGHYHRGSQGALTLEYTETTQDVIGSLATFIQSDFLPVAKSNEMSALLWAKLQLNLGNSINALADIPVKTMLQQRDYRLVIASLMDELLQVTQALDIKLPKVTSIPAQWIPTILRLPDFLFSRLANSMLSIDPNVRTSMWWDVSQGKPTEIDYLNGAIVEQANTLGINCPANTHIVELIKSLSAQSSEKHVDDKGPFSGLFLRQFIAS